jgi:hypothetical protein
MEIKKAWEQMKKDIKKELGISGGFTMTAKQIKNRTATFCICNVIPYEEEIERLQRTMEKVQGYTTWTDEEKARSKERDLQTLAVYEEGLAKYGTKENEAETVTAQIVNSKAFKKFQEEVGAVEWNTEQMDICYYIRFNY